MCSSERKDSAATSEYTVRDPLLTELQPLGVLLVLALVIPLIKGYISFKSVLLDDAVFIAYRI